MPSSTNVQQTILNGSYALEQLTNNNYTLVNSGDLPVRVDYIQWFRLNVQALTDLYSIGDYVSSTLVTIYDRVNQFVGIPYGATVDPNFQNPSIIIDVTAAASIFNSARIPFTNQTTVQLLNYQTAYKPTYGENPILAIFVSVSGTFGQDEGTAPIYTYVTPGDATTGIDTVTWNYGIATSGYIQISGSPT